MTRKSWSPAEDFLLIELWKKPGAFADVIQPHFPDRTERSVQMQAIYLELGPRPSRASTGKYQIQELLRSRGPMTAHQLCDEIKVPYQSVRSWASEMAKAGQIVKAGEVDNGGIGRNAVLWAAGDVPVIVEANKAPKNKKRQACSDAYQRIIDAAKAPRLSIQHHEITCALFGIGEIA